MSRAWIAFYMGDYLKKTQRLTTEQHGAYMLLLMECWQMGSIPLDDRSRAAVARMTLARWQKVGGPVAAFFNPDGTNKRATEEIEKSERISIKRSMAGTVGGRRSGINRAISTGDAIKREANRQQMLSKLPSKNEAIERSNSEANHNSKKEREEGPAQSLASALPTGALAPSPEAKERKGPFDGKKPNEMTKQELDEFYAAKRAKEGKPEPQPEPPKAPVKRDYEFLETPF